MIRVVIENVEIRVKEGISILEACKYVGIHVPRFCYHETLSSPGNCRMCLVEIMEELDPEEFYKDEERDKPVASCATEILDGMVIKVNSAFVKKARENVLEFLLLNHPLDCPVCDQAGECDLQDQAKKYGNNNSRARFNKTVVDNKYFGPLIKSVMTRCITCTRCVRFASEIAGVDYFGTFGRGNATEIDTLLAKPFLSEISGNVVDLCPVGALTSKPYTFKGRPWELRLTESIDVSDSLNANTYINYKGNEIYRILPKINDNLNGTIISDKARYLYAANSINRIIISSNQESEKTHRLFEKDTRDETNFCIDEKCDLDTAIQLKRFPYLNPNKHVTLINDRAKNNFNSNTQVNIQATINQLDAIIIFLATDLKVECSVLNARIRERYMQSFTKTFTFGMSFEDNLNSRHMHMTHINTLFKGKYADIADTLSQSTVPLFVIGENFENRIDDINTFIHFFKKLASNIEFFYIPLKANSQGLQFVNLPRVKNRAFFYTTPKDLAIRESKSQVKVMINLEDSIRTRKSSNFFQRQKMIVRDTWINTHGSTLGSFFYRQVPLKSNFEIENLFVNLENRAQKTAAVVKFNYSSLQDSLFQAKKNYSDYSVTEILKTFDYSSHLREMSKVYLRFETIRNFKEKTQYFMDNDVYWMQLRKYPYSQKLKNFYETDTFTTNCSFLKSAHQAQYYHFINFKRLVQ
jgi:NADH-quinone oxidoreductase subunit G